MPANAQFDRSRLRLKPLAERKNDLDASIIKNLDPVLCTLPQLGIVAERVRTAKECGASCILMMGAHLLRSGAQRMIIDLMERGYLAGVALNGGGMIHDYEFSLIGATTESVPRYISEGQFGLWEETGKINDIVAAGAKAGLGLGEAVGKAITENNHSGCEVSVLAAGYRLGIPVTVHVGIGYDILHEHPNCDGAAYGATSYTDFLKFTHVVEGLERGVVMNFGSAVMAPEVYLKALAMVRNVAHSEGRAVCHFTTLVCDLIKLPEDFQTEAAKGDAGYYYRPWKTMLVRTVADGGESFYVCGNHNETFPQLWSAVRELETSK